MRILHISDLHIKQVNGRIDDSDRCMFHLSETVAEIHSECPIDFIFITGDLVDCGGKSFGGMKLGLDAVEKIVIDRLLKATGLERSRIFLVPGNHDIEGSQIPKNFDSEHILTCEADVNKLIDEIYDGTYIGNQAKARLDKYNKYAESFASASFLEENKICTPLGKHFILRLRNRTIGISCLNSSWRCDEKGKTNNLVLGIKQINEASPLMRNVDCRIALMHHHPSDITDWEEESVKNLFEKEYDILFLGHKHIQNITSMGDRYNKTAYCCATGIVTNNVGDRTYVNGFEIIDVDIDMKTLIGIRYVQNPDESFTRDSNFHEKGFRELEFGKRRKIFPVKDILFNSRFIGLHASDLIESKKLNEIKDEILNQDRKELMIYGFSGLGKTRMVYEAIREYQKRLIPEENRTEFHYCEQSLDSEELRNEIDLFIKNNHDKKIALILDNVDFNLYFYTTNICRYHKNIRIIGVNNRIFDKPEGQLNYVEISPADMTSAVAKYIDDNVADKGEGSIMRESIKQFSHGFPMLAIVLVDKYKKGEKINIHDADSLLDICWNSHSNINRNPEETEFLKLISLFQPFPPGEDVFNAVFGSNLFFPPCDKLSEIDMVRLRAKVRNNYGSSILEINGGGINVRPYPLALHLAKLWLKDNGDPLILDKLSQYVSSLDENLKNKIIECLCQRLNNMNDDPNAVELVAQLTGNGGFFGNENIVCSEMGSRLILAMSTVNPLAVSNALFNVFSNKSAKEIQKILSSRAWTNLFWTFRNLIFDMSSFDKGIELLGKFALVEKEEYANNSINTFCETFHIFLPGTEVSLEKRLNILRKFVASDSESYLLTPHSLRGALSYGQFVRIGSNKFGVFTKENYSPTNDEIIAYWNDVVKIAIDLIEKNKFISEIADIIKKNLLMWAGRGVITFMLPLIETFAIKYGPTLNLSENEWLNFIEKIEHSYKSDKEIMDRIRALHPLFIKENFITELDSVSHNFHKNVRFSSVEYWGKVREYYEPLAYKFINDKIYKNDDLILSLLTQKNFSSNGFATVLSGIISDEQLSELWRAIIKQINKNDSIAESIFISRLTSVSSNRKPTIDFIEEIYNIGKFETYINLMSRCETIDNSSLKILNSRFSTKTFLPYYLQSVNMYSDEGFLTQIYEYIKSHFDEMPEDILSFILRNDLWIDELNDHNLEIITNILIKVDVSQLQGSNEREFWDFVSRVLTIKHDIRLVKNLNQKALELLSELNFDANLGPFYEIAFKNYLDEIWDNFAEALFGENVLPFWNIDHAIGGYKLHSGMIFELPQKYLESALKKYPITAPVRLAKLCPLYDDSNNCVKLGYWPKRLIDEYGNNKSVLNELSSNMGCFSWWGSLIPLYQRQLDVLRPLVEHQIENVRHWACREIEQINKIIQREKDNEDFQRMHYGN